MDRVVPFAMNTACRFSRRCEEKPTVSGATSETTSLLLAVFTVRDIWANEGNVENASTATSARRTTSGKQISFISPPGPATTAGLHIVLRSEERRVGKECRSR